MPRDEGGDLVRPHRAGEPEAHHRTRIGLDDHPCLGLAVREPEVLAGERTRRVHVHRQPLAGVEQLDEDLHVVAAVAPDVVATEPGDRVGDDALTQQRAVREPGQPLRRLAETRRRAGEPLLGPHRATGAAAQRADPVAAAVEVVELVGRQQERCGAHAGPSRRAWVRPRSRMAPAPRPRPRASPVDTPAEVSSGAGSVVAS
jgi:hypothetical protein